MKKFLTLILAITIAMAFVACKKEEAKEPQNDEINTEQELIEEVEDVKEETEQNKAEDKKPNDNKPAEGKPDTKPEESKPQDKPAESKPEQKPEQKPEENNSQETPAVTGKTLGNTLLADFKAKAKAGKSAETIANELLSNPAILFGGATNPVAPGDYLPGFDEGEIKGFKSGVAFMPMIGSIPFVGYVFELDGTVGASDFISTLKKNANLRWLVCAEAEEMVAGSEGNKVFFVMCPKSLEE